MSELQRAESTSHAIAELSRLRSPRKAPRTNEELLALAEKRSGLLRAKVIANRDRQRMKLIDDLYEKYSIEAAPEDRSERLRLATLRYKLGL